MAKNASIYAAFERMWQHVVSIIDNKQNKLTGSVDQIVGFDEDGNAIAIDNKNEIFVPNEYQSYFEQAKELYVGEYENVAILEESQYVTVAFLMDNFTVTEYNKSSTEFKAQGWVAVSCKKADQTWEVQNWMTSPSEGYNFASNIRSSSCYWYYNGENIWPIGSSGAGEKVTGREFKLGRDTVTAEIGAEIFNDYVNNIAVGTYSHAEGSETIAAGAYSHAEGYQTKAMGEATHAEGYGAIAYEDYAHAEGCDTFAHDWASHAEGEGWKAEIYLTGDADGYEYHLTGSNTVYKHLQFNHAPLISYNNIVVEVESWDPDNNIISVSDTLDEHNALSEAVAYIYLGGIAMGGSSHVEGGCGIATGWYSHAEGDSTMAYGDDSHAEGMYSMAVGDTSHAEGSYTAALEYAAHAEGSNTIAVEFADHAEGSTTTAAGGASHAEGDSTLTAGYASHAEGDMTTALARGAHAEGLGDQYWSHNSDFTLTKIKNGVYQLSEPLEGIEIGNIFALIESGEDYERKCGIGCIIGYNTEKTIVYLEDLTGVPSLDDIDVSNSNKTFDGTWDINIYYTGIAKGKYSHVEGCFNIAEGEGSHVQGKGNISYSNYEDIVGKYNLNKKSYTKKESNGTFSPNPNARKVNDIIDEPENGRFQLIGFDETATTYSPESSSIGDYYVYLHDSPYKIGDIWYCQTVAKVTSAPYTKQYEYYPYHQVTVTDAERYEYIQNTGVYAHMVGNGIDNENRSNAHTLDWQGNAWFAGDIYVGSTSGKDRDEGSVKLATEGFAAEVGRSDWNQNDAEGIGYIENRPFGYYNTSHINCFDETGYSQSSGHRYYSIEVYTNRIYQVVNESILDKKNFVNNLSNLTFEFDGQPYTAEKLSYDSNSTAYFGNLRLINAEAEDTEENICVQIHYASWEDQIKDLELERERELSELKYRLDNNIITEEQYNTSANSIISRYETDINLILRDKNNIVYYDIYHINAAGNHAFKLDADYNAPVIIDEKWLPSVPVVKECNKGLDQRFWRGTKEEYDAVAKKEDDVLYVITDEFEVMEKTYLDKATYDPMNHQEDIFTYANNIHTTPKDGLFLRDQVNGYVYVLQMVNGNLISTIGVNHIIVNQMPDKISYTAGESFNPSGMIVTAIYEDGSQQVVDNYEYNPTVETADFVIKYNQAGRIFTSTINLTIV